MSPGDALSQRGLTGGGFGDGHDLRLGQETFRLRRPVGDDGGRRNHEEGCERLNALTALGGTLGGGAVLLDRVGKQGESLHRLTQTHIIGENTAQTLLVQERQPLETLHLVGAQGRLQTGGYRAGRNNLAGSLLAGGLLELGGILSALIECFFSALFRVLFGAFLGIFQTLNQLQQRTHLSIPPRGRMHARRQRLQLREQPRLVTVNAQLTARIVEFASLRNEGAQGLKLGSTQREIGAVTEQNTVRPAVERLKNLGERHGPIIDLHRNAQAEPVARIALAHGDFNQRVGCLHELRWGAVKTHLNSGNTAKLRQNRAEQLAGFPAFDAALLQPGKRRVSGKNGAHRTQYARLKTLIANLAALFTGVTENRQGLYIGARRRILCA